jgi:transcriptional regulator with XRE-family HTH domain
MAKKETTTNAVAILHGRYVKDDPERKASLQEERVNAEVASLIYQLRKEAGISQADLAELIGTTQSVISRLEDADYDGHSLTMLTRIASALNQKLTVVMSARDPELSDLRRAFRRFVRMARKAHGWTPGELAERAQIDPMEVILMEENVGYRPTPLVLHKLSKAFGVPEQRLAVLAGAIRQAPESFQQQASRFAAQSESIASLTDDEKKLFDTFMSFLKTTT